MHCVPSCDGRSVLWRLDLCISKKMKAPYKNTWTGVRWLLLARGACGSDRLSNGFEEGVADCGAHALKAMRVGVVATRTRAPSQCVRARAPAL